MSVEDLVVQANSAGVQLWVERGMLRYRVLDGRLDDELKSRLKASKEDIVSHLSGEERLYSPFPMSSLQQAYWLGEADFYHSHVKAHIYQEFFVRDLSVDRLQQSIVAVVQAQPMLRVRVTEDGQQQIQREIPAVAMAVDDLSHERDLTSFLQKKRASVEDNLPSLEQGPPFYLSLTKTQEGWIIHLALRLFVFDGASAQLFFSLLERAYRGETLTPVNNTYRRYIESVQTVRHTAKYKRAMAYWRERIATFARAPELPLIAAAERKSAPGINREFRRLNGSLSPQHWHQLQAISSQFGVSVNSVLCTVFSEVLSLWSGSDHFCVNIMLADPRQNSTAVRDYIGNCSTTLLLEVKLLGSSFVDNVRQLQSTLYSDISHSEVSGVDFIRLIQCQHAEQPHAYAPVVFSSFLGLERGANTVSQPVAHWELQYGAMKTPQVDLDHQVYLDGDALCFNWDFAADCYPVNVVESMFSFYQALLVGLSEQVVLWNAVDARNSSPFTLTDEQLIARKKPLYHYEQKLIHEGFLTRQAIAPQSIAIQDGEATLVYRELHRSALCLSSRIDAELARLCVQDGEVCVGVYCERSWQQIAAVMGILYSGNAYVPLSHRVPKQRLNAMINAACVRAVVCLPEAVEEFRQLGVATVCIDFSVSDIDTLPVDYSTPVPIKRGVDSLAYVIFTSGTTGLPKGVMVSHAAANNTIDDIIRRFQVNANDRVLALSELSFDLSVFDIFGALCAGATLILPPAAALPDPQIWLDTIVDHKVTLWNSAPALMDITLDCLEQQGGRIPDELSLVMLSGDWIPLSLHARLRNCSKAKLISLGGATEAAIWSNYFEVEEILEHWTSIPYGYALSNQYFYILDRQLRQVPDWVKGELYIGGSGLALGYIGEKALTDKAFITHPQTGERLYRTGDTGRYWPDGTMEFLGRNDFQLKVRGFRIELGDIESSLQHHPAISKAVAIVMKDDKGNNNSIALFYTCKDGKQLQETQVKDFLRACLPDYMVPTTAIGLDALPYNTNGKVDRNAMLRQLDGYSADKVQTLQAPETDLEDKLYRIWCEILGHSRLSVTDSFFEVGGDSLSATIMSRLVMKTLDCRFAPWVLIEHDTIKKMARYIAGHGPASATHSGRDHDRDKQCLLPISTNGADANVFLVHPVGGSIACYHRLAKALPAYNVYGLQMSGVLGATESLSTLASKYVECIRTLAGEKPFILAGWSLGGVIALEMSNRLQEMHERPACTFMFDSYCGFEGFNTAQFGNHELVVGFVNDLLNGRLSANDISELVTQTVSPGTDASALSSINAGTKPATNPKAMLNAVLPRLTEQRLLSETLLVQDLVGHLQTYMSLYHALLNHRPTSPSVPAINFTAINRRENAFVGLQPIQSFALDNLKCVDVDADHFNVFYSKAVIQAMLNAQLPPLMATG